VPASVLSGAAALGASAAIGSLGSGSGVWAAQVVLGTSAGVLVFVATALILRVGEVRSLVEIIRGRNR
jgi:hypothetical protein